ncbi:response regulator [Variovorax sp. J22R24]|uniref:response regulator n=1 Tax=Variovorax gracilis TaxID=3053502 RepID=UPI002576ED67|nr:response regulator [Variovorax sp. J22R24]MDM0106711.1 response regulator [Variovorax sp. J22R24]
MASTAKDATGGRTDSAKGESAKGLRVLVVEDDPDALAATVEMLQLLGHWAAGVRSAETAKDRYLDGAFDVLLTDIGLPALSGMDLVESLRTRQKLEVIFATGRPAPAEPIEGTLWLQKPFTVEQLESALSRAKNRTEA